MTAIRLALRILYGILQENLAQVAEEKELLLLGLGFRV